MLGVLDFRIVPTVYYVLELFQQCVMFFIILSLSINVPVLVSLPCWLLIFMLSAFGTDILDTQLAPRGPIMKIQPNNVVITSHSNQPNLECMAYGIPQPTYTWLRGDNLQIVIRPSTNYVLTNGKLTFLNVSTEIAYSGSYQCKAENKYGSVLSNVVRITHGCKFVML